MREYHRHFNVRIFTYSRPFRKAATKSSNEFMDCGVGRYCLKGEVFCQRQTGAFPMRLRMFFIILWSRFRRLGTKIWTLWQESAMPSSTSRSAPQSFTSYSGRWTLWCGTDPKYAPFLDGSYVSEHPEIEEDLVQHPEKRPLLNNFEL